MQRAYFFQKENAHSKQMDIQQMAPAEATTTLQNKLQRQYKPMWLYCQVHVYAYTTYFGVKINNIDNIR